MQTDREKDGRTDMMKLPVAFHNFFQYAWKGKRVKKMRKVDNNIKNIFKQIFCA